MPGARMNQPRKPETDLERSRRLREEATEASQRLGRVAHELLEQRAATTQAGSRGVCAPSSGRTRRRRHDKPPIRRSRGRYGQV